MEACIIIEGRYMRKRRITIIITVWIVMMMGWGIWLSSGYQVWRGGSYQSQGRIQQVIYSWVRSTLRMWIRTPKHSSSIWFSTPSSRRKYTISASLQATSVPLSTRSLLSTTPAGHSAPCQPSIGASPRPQTRTRSTWTSMTSCTSTQSRKTSPWITK